MRYIYLFFCKKYFYLVLESKTKKGKNRLRVRG